MSTTDETRPAEDGFEYKLPGDDTATFFRWSVSTGTKDLMLIDRFTALPIRDFFEQVEDSFDRGRAPILFALIATSIRARLPEWSIERITRTVQNLSLDDIEFIDVDEEPAGPLAEKEEQPEETSSESSTSPSDESKSSATREELSASGTSAGSPA